MSGYVQLANAVMNDPAFAKQTDGLMTVAKAKEIVGTGDKGAKIKPLPKGK